MIRVVLLAILLLLFPSGAPTMAAGTPYRVSLVGDAPDDGGWITGVRIELSEGWKTYWRMPGDSGIPPQFTWTASVPATMEVTYPLPTRHSDAAGDTVGYEGEVIFPVRVQAGRASAVDLELDLFFGVCKDVCIPARASAAISLGPATRDIAGSRAVAAWMERVPMTGTPVKAAEIVTRGGRPVLRLTLTSAVDDIFVESGTAAYFRKPVFLDGGRVAELAIDNIHDITRLAATALRITVSAAGRGLEQTLTLP